MEVLSKVGFQVVILSFDNATPNRKFYTHELCSGKLQTSVPHPHECGKPIFLSFDAVHNFKNLYNNFINRRELWFPSFPSEVSVEETNIK